MSGTTRAGLDLVEDEDRVELVAEFAQALQETLGRYVDAALALDRLDQDGGRLGPVISLAASRSP
jgi:outer membrane scaffolding protein for murein synthesis (MipA/OmpV family)